MNHFISFTGIVCITYLASSFYILSFTIKRRRTKTVYWNMILLYITQLIAAFSLITLHTLEGSPIIAILWGLNTCLSIHNVRFLLTKRRIPTI